MKNCGEITYSQLYRLVENNMEASGNHMEFQEGTFLSALGDPANVADILKWRNNSDQVFLENLYMQLLERFPDEYARKRWEKEDGSRIEHQCTMLRTVVNSHEFLLKKTYIKNNIYEDQISVKYSLKEKLLMSIVQILRPVMSRMPQSIKIAIKRGLNMA